MTEAFGAAPLRVSAADMELFSAASHDRNPLHRSAVYARRSPFGQPVVFGVLAALACLGRLGSRVGQTLSSLDLEFRTPLFPGVAYAVDTLELTPRRHEITVLDGSQVVQRAGVTFRDGEPDGLPASPAPESANHVESMDREVGDLVPGMEVGGRYAPDWSSTRRLMEQFQPPVSGVGASHVAALLWSSYLVGMELPGRRALFVRLSLRFDEAGRTRAGEPLEYLARVRTVNRRSLLLTADVRLGGADAPWASGEVSALIRPDVAAPSQAAVEAVLPRSDALRGRVGLVIGASRGLGAALALCLASQGCTVEATFQTSEAEALRLKASSALLSGSISLRRGDGADLAWCEEVRGAILRDHGRLDYLVCNASPSLLSMRMHARTVSRVNEYVSQSFGLVSVPVAVFLPLVSQHAGWLVTISSSAVGSPLPDWPHYLSAKYAVEGLTRAAATDQRAASYLIVRPPRLLTDLLNTPLGREGATPPERVAARIVQHLMGPAAPGRVQVLDDLL
jgi:NAD(P)-dependent dehydrogenase (short-subunit alcohol dehydrogenase family)/acyl dehydratase